MLEATALGNRPLENTVTVSTCCISGVTFVASLCAVLHAATPDTSPQEFTWSNHIVSSHFLSSFLVGLLSAQWFWSHLHGGVGGVLLVNSKCTQHVPHETPFCHHLTGNKFGNVWVRLVHCVCGDRNWGQTSLTLRGNGDFMTILSLVVTLGPSTP